mmetsp:Transcript_51278/g.129437  ORF Transcript_51278/g.129437 Transcript_51278/m.129437 type:complete len:219 (+) Transcript_51278:297-953(+)
MSSRGVPVTCSLQATSSHNSVGSVRPLTVTKSTVRKKKFSRTPSSSQVLLSTRIPTLYLLHNCSKREAKLTLSPTRPYFIRLWLPMLPAKTEPQTRPMRALTSGRPRSAQCFLSLPRRCCCCMAAESASTVCLVPRSQGAFHQAMISSPINSPTMPLCSMIMPLISSRYSPRSSARTGGSSTSAILVKSAMSLKKTVTCAFATPSLACCPLCTSSFTM